MLSQGAIRPGGSCSNIELYHTGAQINHQAKPTQKVDQAMLFEKGTRQEDTRISDATKKHIKDYFLVPCAKVEPSTPQESLADDGDQDDENAVLQSFVVFAHQRKFEAMTTQYDNQDDDDEGIILERFIVFAHQRKFKAMTASYKNQAFEAAG